MYRSENLRVDSTPSGGYILERRIGEDWEPFYSVSGPTYNSCKVCGFPIKENQKCKHHNGLLDLKLDIDIAFIGYYKTDINSQPLNAFSKRLLSMKTPDGLQYISELSLLLNILFRSRIKGESIKWGTWVPSSNPLLENLARQLILENNLSLIEPSEIFHYNENIHKARNHQAYVKEKYSLKEKINKKVLDAINDKAGVIIDDIIHTCFTIGRIFELINSFNPKKIFCFALARTSKGKHPSIIKYPNLP